MDVLQWLTDGDPAIRWQAMRDLAGASADVISAERARVATEGWGARLLALQAGDGAWGGGAYGPGWTSTTDVLQTLQACGADPADERVRAAVERVRDGVTWGEEFGDNAFFDGEVEPCINGRAHAAGAYFGEPSASLLDRLLGEQLDDGGWNCEAPGSSRSSFNTTICVLEGLLEHEAAAGPVPEVTDARVRGQEYLLERGLMRSRSTGAVVNETWTRFAFPVYWHYDVLRALDYLRRAGVSPDDRIAEAVALVASRRGRDGRWTLEHRHPGDVPFEMEAVGEPSRWIALRALRVLDWADTGTTPPRPAPTPAG